MVASRSLRVGFLVDNLTSEYPVELATGVLRAGREKRVQIVIVPGGELGNPGSPAAARNFVYDWVTKARLDGVVVSAGSLSNHCGLPRFGTWLAGLASGPAACIGVQVEGVASVHVDNETGMHEVVSHLIRAHGRRRIAFIGGPDTSTESRARRDGYLRALRECDISADDRLMIRTSTLGREDGVAATTELFERRHFSRDTLDAIVCMNDDIAFGVLDELNRRSLVVPKDVAVASFDDSSGSRIANPPLTTVSQQIELQGYTAARNLIEALEQCRKPEGAQLKSAAVIRNSCGCTLPIANSSRALAAPNLRLARNLRLALIERRGVILAELARAASGRLAGLSSWDAHLLDALVQDLASEPVAFLRELENQLRQHTARGRGLLAFHDVLTALRLQALMCASIDPESRPLVEDLFQEARFVVARIGSEVESTRNMNLGMHLRNLWRGCLSQLGSASPEALAPLLDRHLPGLGITAFCISRLRDGAIAGSELEIVCRRSALGVTRPSPTLGIADLGIEAGLRDEPALVVKPLEFGGRAIGVAVFSWGAFDPMHYAQLREMLGPALFGAAGLR